MAAEKVDVVILGGGSAGSNAARAAFNGSNRVIMVHPEGLINTCVEEGCMPSKSVLAGAHQGEPLGTILETRDAHIDRLRNALVGGFDADGIVRVEGTAMFVDDNTVKITGTDGTEVVYDAGHIIIATGSTPFIPPIPGLDPEHERVLISDDVVSKGAGIDVVPKRVLTIGGGPIGLELSTFFHDMGAHVDVLQRGGALAAFDPEFGEERVRASADASSFPIHLDANLTNVEMTDTGAECTIDFMGETKTEVYDVILVATGRKPNTQDLGLENTSIERDERGGVTHDEHMRTSVPHIYIAGDVTGHHQILHFASAMGQIAGRNAGHNENEAIDYDRLMLAVSFDQFPSALIGLTETEAKKRGIEVITATRHFNSIGLGILKRQEYGLWKLVAEKDSGRIIGAQVLGPDSSGELVQLLSPVIYNKNTHDDILAMTWYHPTYAEILQSLARDLAKQHKSLTS